MPITRLEKCEYIVANLYHNYKDKGLKFYNRALRKIINKVAGAQERTIKGYMMLLEFEGYIRSLNYGRWKLTEKGKQIAVFRLDFEKKRENYKNVSVVVEGMKLTCHRCNREWPYKGKRKWYATCPDCHAQVKIPKKEAEP